MKNEVMLHVTMLQLPLFTNPPKHQGIFQKPLGVSTIGAGKHIAKEILSSPEIGLLL
jgi:hypothetical protein